MAPKPAILIIVENLPVPLDRRVWQEACALRDMGYQVVIICPQMKGYTASEELLDGIQIYRHKISLEANGILGFFSNTPRHFGERQFSLGKLFVATGSSSFTCAILQISSS